MKPEEIKALLLAGDKPDVEQHGTWILVTYASPAHLQQRASDDAASLLNLGFKRATTNATTVWYEPSGTAA